MAAIVGRTDRAMNKPAELKLDSVPVWIDGKAVIAFRRGPARSTTPRPAR